LKRPRHREIGRIAVEIEERDPARAQDLGDLITEMGSGRAGNVARRQAFDALRIEDEKTVVLIGLLDRAEPGEELLSRFRGGRPIEGFPRQTQERGVLEKDLAVPPRSARQSISSLAFRSAMERSVRSTPRLKFSR